jgi:hypothetical protein
MSSRLWSVTTLQKLGLGNSDAIVGWAVKATAEYAVDNLEWLATVAEKDRDAALKLIKGARWTASKKALMRGSEVHAAAERIAYGETPELSDEARPYVNQYLRFLDEHQPTFEMAEAPVYNLSFHYAGTLDAIVTIGGRRCVLDMKTTAKQPDGSDGSRPPFPEVALQLVAYRRAELVGLGPPNQVDDGGRRYYVYDPSMPTVEMPETDGALALLVSPFDYELVPVRADDDVWNAFLYVREIARWQVDTSTKVIGPTIAPPKQEAVA